MLARVLVSEPELLLLDEPTAGVDDATVTILFDLLRRLNRESGLTVLMVTHDAERAAACVSRILCLENGSLLELSMEQLNEELLHRHRHTLGGDA
jgi:zinc transport system ATP-binding protein